MNVNQIYNLMNNVTDEVLGKTGLITEDLQGVVELGDTILNAISMDKYVKSLVNHIGKVIFVNRSYSGSAPSVLMDGWEFGSILEKVHMDLPEATENESWELEDGTSYDPNIFYKPKVEAKFFNNIVTFEVPCSFTDKQVKQSFSSATQLNAFLSMIYNAVDKAMTLKFDALIMRTIDNMIGETVYDDFNGASLSSKSGVKAINLLYIYNNTINAGGTPLTADECIFDKNFLKFASSRMNLYLGRLKKMSTLFNVGGKERFTPNDLLHVILLDEFTANCSSYLESDTFHNELVKLPKYETVPYWQGTGVDYSFTNTAQIDITTSAGHSVNATGILGVMFDHDALGVNNQERRVTTNYNGKAEFTNNWYKFEARFFNDLNENFIVFFVA